MTQERIMFLNPTQSKPRLSAAATMSDDTPSALTLPLHCASILQPAAPPQVVAFESKTISTPIRKIHSLNSNWRFYEITIVISNTEVILKFFEIIFFIIYKLLLKFVIHFGLLFWTKPLLYPLIVGFLITTNFSFGQCHVQNHLVFEENSLWTRVFRITYIF